MKPERVRRDQLARLEDLPNIGPAMAGDLRRLGIHTPDDLIGQDAYVMHRRLSELTGVRQDPCVIDVFLSVVRFMAGGLAQPWWAFTEERKRMLAGSAVPASGRMKRASNPMPEFVRCALEERGLTADYAARPPSQRNDYLGWIARGRRPQTRERRLGQMLDELERGGVYMNMAHPASRKS